MTANALTPRRRPILFSVGLLLCLGVVTPSVEVLASHGGPVFYVDANNPPEDDVDRDFHFHSLGAALRQFPNPQQDDTLLVAPGRYAEGEDIVLDIEGLKLRGSDPGRQTLIEGTFVVAGKRVQLSNLTVDASGRASGVVIEQDDTSLQGLSIFGAEVGVLIAETAPEGLLIERCRLYHNGVGIKALGVRRSRFVDNIVEANTSSGGQFDRAYDVNFEGNTWSSNGGTGIEVHDGQLLQFNDENFSNNTDRGGVFERTSQVQIERATVVNNGVFGLVFNAVQDGELRTSTFERNKRSGLRLEHRSQQNRVLNNAFLDHAQRNSAGLWLAGDVYDNVFGNNTFVGNFVGIRLSAREADAPAGNRFEHNSINNSNEDGVRVESSEGNNIFSDNDLEQNGGHGVSWTGRNDIIENNRVARSGGSGMALDGATHTLISNNELFDGRGYGIHLSGPSEDNILSQNNVHHNAQDGVYLEGGRSNSLQGNAISKNKRNGVRAQRSEQLTLSNNRISYNGKVGVVLKSVKQFTARYNTVVGNNLGGVAVRSSESVDLEANAIQDNLHTGLTVSDSQVLARRNWWGDPLGPAGTFSGRGNAAVGLTLEEVSPWLPDVPQRLELNSVMASAFEGVDAGETLTFDFRDRAGLQINVDDLGLEQDGRHTPFSLAEVLVARYRTGFANDAIEPLLRQLALYSVQVGGFQRGKVELLVDYASLPSDVQVETLRLWWWTGTAWSPLDSAVRTPSQQVVATLEAAQLQPGLIALAPERTIALPQTLSTPLKAVQTASKSTVVPETQRATHAFLTVKTGLLLLPLLLFSGWGWWWKFRR